MLKNLEDASQIGIRFAMSFIGLLFSIILIALFIIPYKVIIEKKIV
jgi:flagellar motor component MotA